MGKVQRVLADLMDEASHIMLFLKSLTRIEVLHWAPDAAAPELLFDCSVQVKYAALSTLSSLCRARQSWTLSGAASQHADLQVLGLPFDTVAKQALRVMAACELGLRRGVSEGPAHGSNSDACSALRRMQLSDSCSSSGRSSCARQCRKPIP